MLRIFSLISYIFRDDVVMPPKVSSTRNDPSPTNVIDFQGTSPYDAAGTTDTATPTEEEGTPAAAGGDKKPALKSNNDNAGMASLAVAAASGCTKCKKELISGEKKQGPHNWTCPRSLRIYSSSGGRLPESRRSSMMRVAKKTRSGGADKNSGYVLEPGEILTAYNVMCLIAYYQ